MAQPSASRRTRHRLTPEKTLETNIENTSNRGNPVQAPKLSAEDIKELRDLVRVVREAAEEERRAPTSRSRALASRALQHAVANVVNRSLQYGIFMALMTAATVSTHSLGTAFGQKWPKTTYTFGHEITAAADSARMQRWDVLGNVAGRERTRLRVERGVRELSHAKSDEELRKALVEFKELKRRGALHAVARDVAKDIVARARGKPPSRVAELMRQYVPAIVQRAAYSMYWFEFGRAMKRRDEKARADRERISKNA